MKVEIYADGASRGNPGRGGFGCVVKTENGERKEFSCGYKLTTNNRMEILAAIVGIESLKESENITVISDSRYLTDAFNRKWVQSWKKNNWVTFKKEPVKNQDLWMRLLKAMKKHKKVKYVWIKGHDGHTENERCDYLATTAADDMKNLKRDTVYEELYDTAVV